MPDSFNSSGLTVATASEITAALTSGLQGIYGADINVDQNSPDGQMIGILTQMAVDIRELLVQINSSFDPDQAQGALLDQRLAINKIQRHGGTYTQQPMTLVVNATVTLQGLDAAANEPLGTGYTVQDGNGNQFILLDSNTFTAGTYTGIAFRAQKIGAVNVPVNTITNPLTIVPGVVSVNNPSAATSVGQDQETDPQARTRRQSSVANSSAGYLNGLEGTLAALTGVTSAKVYENVTDSIDGDGIPAHGIWCIVNGGADSAIGNAIYQKKDPGANMKGSVTVPITTISGGLFTAKFDRPTPADLYLKFSIQTIVTGYSFDQTSIKAYIAAHLSYGVGDFAETSVPTSVARDAIAQQGGGGVPLLMQVGDDGVAWTDFLDAATLASQWTLDPSRITITIIP